MTSRLIDEARLALGLISAFHHNDTEAFDILLTDMFKSAELMIATTESLCGLTLAVLETVATMTHTTVDHLLTESGVNLLQMEISGDWDDDEFTD